MVKMTLLDSVNVDLATMDVHTSISKESEDKIKCKEKNSEIKEHYKTIYLWDRIVAFSFLHIVGVYAVFLTLTSWRHFTLFLFHYFTTGNFVNLGITMGAHRLWAHRSFKATLPIKIILLIAQAMAGQNSLFVWVRDHRAHHKFSDTDADPHNASRGFFFSHIGWLLMKKHPEVKRRGKSIDMSDLSSDPWVMLQYKYFFSIFIITNIMAVYVSYFIGYTLSESVMIGFFLRYVLTLHFTWSVNSVAHFFGSKPYTRHIKPVESNLVSFLTKGEGWHNYHHTFPWDYKAGEFGNKNNFTCQVIEFFAKYGLVYDLKNASSDMVKNRVIKHGDGTHDIIKKDY